MLKLHTVLLFDSIYLTRSLAGATKGSALICPSRRLLFSWEQPNPELHTHGLLLEAICVLPPFLTSRLPDMPRPTGVQFQNMASMFLLLVSGLYSHLHLRRCQPRKGIHVQAGDRWQTSGKLMQLLFRIAGLPKERVGSTSRSLSILALVLFDSATMLNNVEMPFAPA